MSAAIIPKGVPVKILRMLGDQDPIVIQATLTSRTAACPRCGHWSSRIRSHYWRQIDDLPWHGIRVSWQVGCRQFVCPVPGCAQRIFCERLPAQWVVPYGRRTQAVQAALTAWGWAATAADMARVCGSAARILH